MSIFLFVIASYRKLVIICIRYIVIEPARCSYNWFPCNIYFIITFYLFQDGIQYQEALFNQTVTITDVSEGMDGETFFLYIFLLAFAVLILLAGHHFLTSFGRKKTEARKAPVETGTNVKKGIDYDWIPKEHLRK